MITAKIEAIEALYTVQQGDTLPSATLKFYHDVSYWQEIYRVNRSTIGRDPNRFQPGTVLLIPETDHSVNSMGIRPYGSVPSVDRT